MAEDRLNLPFTGLVSFMRVPTCTDLSRIEADIAILGAPTDEGSPWKPGARFAPRKIRELSVKYAGYGPIQSQLGYYDIDENRRFLEYEREYSRIVDCGDSDIIYTNVRRTFDNITRDVRAILDAGVFPVVIGGDHAITYPVVRAYQERLNVVHFDAHMDYRPFVHGVQWANGNPIRSVSKLKTCHHIIQVGIRSLRTRQADVEDSRARGNDIVTIPEFRRRGPESIVDRLPRNEPVYVSIDVDVLDLPLVPGCASSEVNGLTYDELSDPVRDRQGAGGHRLRPSESTRCSWRPTTSRLGPDHQFLGRIVEHPDYESTAEGTRKALGQPQRPPSRRARARA
jgi:agmatinase